MPPMEDEKDPEVTEEVEVEEDEDEEEDTEESSEEGDEPETKEGEGTEDEDTDLPTDPKALQQIIREQAKQTQQLQGLMERAFRGQPPAREEAPDEFDDALGELMKDPKSPVGRVVGRLVTELGSMKEQIERKSRDDAARANVKPKHMPQVEALAQKFGLPISVANQIYKGHLYDQAMARKAAKDGDEPEPEPRPKGKAPLTRPVRQGASEGKTSGTLIIDGVKIKTLQRPGEYGTLMDKLKPETRKKVLALRSDGKIKVE